MHKLQHGKIGCCSRNNNNATQRSNHGNSPSNTQQKLTGSKPDEQHHEPTGPSIVVSLYSFEKRLVLSVNDLTVPETIARHFPQPVYGVEIVVCSYVVHIRVSIVQCVQEVSRDCVGWLGLPPFASKRLCKIIPLILIID